MDRQSLRLLVRVAVLLLVARLMALGRTHLLAWCGAFGLVAVVAVEVRRRYSHRAAQLVARLTQLIAAWAIAVRLAAWYRPVGDVLFLWEWMPYSAICVVFTLIVLACAVLYLSVDLVRK